MLDELERLKQTYLSLRNHTSVWSRSDDILMNQALLLVAMEATHRCEELPAYLQRCQDSAGFFSSLRGPLLDTIGVLGMVDGVDPKTIVDRAAVNKKLLRAADVTGFFSSGSIYALGTSAYLAVRIEDASAVIQKMKLIMDGWSVDHPWVTGSNDLFFAMLHAFEDGEPAAQAELTEQCFQALRRGGHSGWADELQAAAQMVALCRDLDLQQLEQRYRALSKQLSAEFSFFAPNLRPTVSLIAASELPLETAVERLMGSYNQIGELCSVGRQNRLILAANLTLLTQPVEQSQLKARLVALVIAVIYAEQAAVAAAAAATAAT